MVVNLPYGLYDNMQLEFLAISIIVQLFFSGGTCPVFSSLAILVGECFLIRL